MRKLLVLLISSYGVCHANGMQALEKFLGNKTISADFTQTVTGNKKNTTTKGNLEIARPNKFRWQYTNGQLIVSNSTDVYIYDKDLQQVTVRKLQASLGKSPAVLLAGGKNVKNYYKVTNLPDSDNLEWVELTPKSSADNNGLQQVAIGFSKSSQQLSQMCFIDSFGNKSVITFTNVEVSVKFAPTEFNFTPPKDADILSE
jgi:NAD+ synthase (glutamine-hydrolysing)/outer membrane lipoprotein carrier protein